MASPRSYAITCLFFDKVVCHFPIFCSPCGQCQGNPFSDCVAYDEYPLLVESGVLDVAQQELVPGVGDDLPWDSDQGFEEYCKLQVTAMAMDLCSTTGAVPITNSAAWPIPANMLCDLDLFRSTRIQASALAMQSVEVVLPPFANMTDDGILQLREELKEQLIPFRRAMVALSPTVRSAMGSGATLMDVYREAKYVVDTRVVPALEDLKDKLRKEKKKFWRQLIFKAGAVLPNIVLNWTTQGAISAAVDAVNRSEGLILGALDHDHLVRALVGEGGLGFLLALGDHEKPGQQRTNRGCRGQRPILNPTE